MKNAKRLTSLFLILVMLVSGIALPLYALADSEWDEYIANRWSYVDGDGIYHRYSHNDGFYVDYQTDYQKMLDDFRNALMNHESGATVYFATNDTKYSYVYDVYSDDSARTQREYKNAIAVARRLWTDVYRDVFLYKRTGEYAQCGDYLFNSIDIIGSMGFIVYPNGGDVPVGDADRYYPFKITIGDVEYNTTKAMDQAVRDFAQEFNAQYLDGLDNDYDKVKTIYDFVVRNSTYDYDTFNGEYGQNTQRYKIAHSAYGALYGNLIKNGKSISEFDMSYKLAANDEKIVDKYNQGLAVCEGYSKLFYYLCNLNNIPCRIVDGDYIEGSGNISDPHEWNYVWLDDGCGDGYKWFQVDATFASQNSIKEIDFANYDFFLRGRENTHFGTSDHQQPYADFGLGDYEKEQIFDWYSEENVSSWEDYRFRFANLSARVEASHGTILCRETDYGGETGVRYAFIFVDKNGLNEINVDEDGNVSFEHIDGFTYTGYEATFTAQVPYMVLNTDSAYSEYSNVMADATVVGDAYDPVTNPDGYRVIINGAGDSSISIPFAIVPMDMSNDKPGNYSEVNVQNTAPYTGNVMRPTATLFDGYNHELFEGKDYEIKYYSDAAMTHETEVKEMGKYYCDIAFCGNYSGHYLFEFSIGKVDLSNITHQNLEFNYLPLYFRKAMNVTTPTAFYKAGASSLKLDVGTLVLSPDVDFTISATGSLEYGHGGTVTLRGKNGSTKVEAGSSLSFDYTISKKYDITTLYAAGAKRVADTGRVNQYVYNRKAQKPTKFDWLDERLVPGKDYEIVSYSDNINAGEAKVKIRGIGGCTGEETFIFYINKASMSDVELKASYDKNTGVVNYTTNYLGKGLEEGVDYTVKTVTTSNGFKLVLTGKGNFAGTAEINFTNDVTPVNPTTPDIYPAPTKLKSLSAKKKQITVKWTKVTTGKVDGYRIEYATNKAFTKNLKSVMVEGRKKVSYTIKGLKRKKKYFVRVKAYYKSGKYIYLSASSNVKYISTK